ncbi:response regulator [Evansella sp. AB-P1]|uniref:response regulator n=1 Tax=Evansella sp. AB-P1 TaxID=3037653 RepID=UPI00241C3BBD|nr:response regulator [Evansella sp. AB-P1]MDG5786297.1 response regulator [Evansella sp. AB-P1]
MEDLSILVCDDSETIRKQMIDTLGTIGITNVYEASNGEEAIFVCREKEPHLVFMDIIMPKKDGIAALKEIHHQFPHVKVVMASSTSGLAHLKKSKLLGAYSFIQKPISEITLMNIINKYLDERSKSRSKV